MSTLVVRGPAALSGDAVVPGDKSITHRALMLGACAPGDTVVRNAAPGEDVVSTAACLAAYGIEVDREGGVLVVRGRGFGGWTEPAAPLSCGNSGTTMRLLAGLAAHHPFASVLDGDASLRARPMDRLVGPLGALGATVETTGGHPPITVSGGSLHGARVETGVASAQVKSAALFAALAAEGTTSVTEPALSRDHTERLLGALGASVHEARGDDGGHTVEVEPFSPPAFEIEVPGDISSAAFLLAGGVLTGRVRVDGVGLNPSRMGFAHLLQRMGADVRWTDWGMHMGEPVGEIEASRSALGGISVEGPAVPAVLDELPLLAVLATQARGTTTVTGAGELRVKESDRVASVVSALRLLGAEAEELPDGFRVHGPTPLSGTDVDPAGDHRVAMAMAIAALTASGETLIDGFDCAAVSWPGFERALSALGADVEVR